MLKVTELNGHDYYINPDQIEKIDKNPDTVITLITGKKLVVKETPEYIVDKYIEVKRKIFGIAGGSK
ncbi:MAG: flagellar FlbD family protein [Candidatus Muirbacterium halophilum]|nr:flagellar FlbD family protein [Candidatus Muirbacterium halophilum]MCK9476074.1 flagellar FlbD family protein [Candidatus Muirbacterium halophilum]